MNVVWTEAENDFILANAGRLKDWELALELTRLTGRSVSRAAARQKRQRLGLKKEAGRGISRLRIFQMGKDEGLPLSIVTRQNEVC